MRVVTASLWFSSSRQPLARTLQTASGYVAAVWLKSPLVSQHFRFDAGFGGKFETFTESAGWQLLLFLLVHCVSVGCSDVFYSSEITVYSLFLQ
jgi:hypothetical protein